MVSPGPLKPSFHFQRVAHSGYYLLPHYVSAFILANEIKLFFPGLGSWNSSNSENQQSEAVNILMKYGYAPVLTGGVGPFSFEFPAGKEHNYQLRRMNGGLQLTLPGAQVIGYIMKTIPKFPLNQTSPPMDVVECNEDSISSPTHLRGKRSSSDEPSSSFTSNIKKLAKSLFSTKLGPVLPEEHLELMRDKEMVSTKYIERLIKDGDLKREKLIQFIRSIEKSGNPGSPANTTVEEIAYE